MMRDLARVLPATAWLMALPQLISRICHPHQDTRDVIQDILVGAGRGGEGAERKGRGGAEGGAEVRGEGKGGGGGKGGGVGGRERKQREAIKGKRYLHGLSQHGLSGTRQRYLPELHLCILILHALPHLPCPVCNPTRTRSVIYLALTTRPPPLPPTSRCV